MATYDQLPTVVCVREFTIETTGKDGKPATAVVVSTITDPDVRQDESSALYWARWNVELDFRSIKCALQMDILRAKSPSMVHTEIWCHVLAYNLLRGTMVESAKRNDMLPRQISVKGAMQAVESFTPAIMSGGGDAIYAAFLQTVAAHRVGNRPGRQEPRFKKRRPQWRDFMTIPRHLSQRCLASQAKRTLS